MFVESWMPAIFSPQHRLLHASFVFFIIPYLYSYLNEQHRMASYSVEQAMSFQQYKVLYCSFNCNVDLIVPGTHVIDSLNTTYNEWIESVSDLHETFIHFFQRGAPAERYGLKPLIDSISQNPYFYRITKIMKIHVYPLLFHYKIVKSSHKPKRQCILCRIIHLSCTSAVLNTEKRETAGKNYQKLPNTCIRNIYFCNMF
uniref:Uncharacterized protein n=1 Tax=Heterorhabditis bacteriophora TaxID=37862 RepID=A0A1I7X559_HETBA